MNKTFAKTTTFCALLLLAGTSLAATQTRNEGDMLYGNGAVKAAPSDPYQITGPVQQGSEGSMLWNLDNYSASQGEAGSVRIVDDRPFSTDIIYGS